MTTTGPQDHAHYHAKASKRTDAKARAICADLGLTIIDVDIPHYAPSFARVYVHQDLPHPYQHDAFCKHVDAHGVRLEAYGMELRLDVLTPFFSIRVPEGQGDEQLD